MQKNRPTQRAPDVWDSAAFLSIFLASGFSCSQAESTPAHTQVTQTVELSHKTHRNIHLKRRNASGSRDRLVVFRQLRP